MSESSQPLVGVIMGSRSDWETMSAACETLETLGVPYEKRVVSAHRTPDLMFEYAGTAADRGIQVIIAAAGGAAHLPGLDDPDGRASHEDVPGKRANWQTGKGP